LEKNRFEYLIFFSFFHILFNCLTGIKISNLFFTHFPSSTLLYDHKNAVSMMDLRCVEREKKSPHHQFFVGSLPPHLRSLWCLIPFPYLAFPFVAVVALTMRCLDSPCLAWPFLAYALSCRGDNDLA
jgi:hypothetical protein